MQKTIMSLINMTKPILVHLLQGEKNKKRQTGHSDRVTFFAFFLNGIIPTSK